MLKKYTIDFKLLTNILAIALFGIVNIYLCTKGSDVTDPFMFTKKQLVWLLISLVSMYIILIFDYRVIYSYVPVVYWITIALLIAVWIPGIGAKINGERGWLNLRVFYLQPSEIAKFAIILVMAKLLEDMECKINDVNNLFKIACYVSLPMGLILIQKDMGMTMVCFFIILGIVYIAGLDKKIILGGVSILALSILILWNSGLIFEHQKDRIIEFLNADNDITGQGYQLFQGIISIGSGGFHGNNLSFNPKVSPGYAGSHVPEVQTDFIFTSVAEHWGFLGSVVLLILYGVLVMQILNIAKRARNKFGELICVGIASYILFAVTQNIGMTLRILPITGITLPFVSYGGSSLWTTMISMALVLNIELQTRKSMFGKSHTEDLSV